MPRRSSRRRNNRPRGAFHFASATNIAAARYWVKGRAVVLGMRPRELQTAVQAAVSISRHKVGAMTMNVPNRDTSTSCHEVLLCVEPLHDCLLHRPPQREQGLSKG